MHEMSTCKRLIRQVEKFAASYPERPIKNIRLSIGELARIDIDELVELFPLASKGTCAEFASLSIERKAVSVKCSECKKTSDVSVEDMNCPACGSENTQLISGTDMLLEALEF